VSSPFNAVAGCVAVGVGEVDRHAERGGHLGVEEPSELSNIAVRTSELFRRCVGERCGQITG